MNLEKEITKFDGKLVNELESLAKSLPKTSHTINHLLKLATQQDVKIQTGATWVLKRFVELDVGLTKSQANKVIDLLGDAEYWQTKLHLAQMLAGVKIPSKRKKELYRILTGHACDENKLVRAWSYNGLFVLADQHQDFRDSVVHLLKVGQEDGAASVSARIRQIAKKSKWVEL